MKQQKLMLSLITATALTLVGCGGGGGGGGGDSESSNPTNSTVTGIFKDANVAGLNYSCSSGSTGITNTKGEFTCKQGDTVSFSLGGYALGSVTASSGTVTPMALYPNDPEAVTNVLQLLQTLDDGADGTITIPENYTTLNGVTTPPTAADFDSVMEQRLGQPLVSPTQAHAHMLQTIIAGNTLYTTIDDQMGTLESWSFNGDISSVTWQEMVGGSGSDTESASLSGNVLTIDGNATITFTQTLSDYMVAEVVDGNHTEHLRVYYSESAARAYFLATTPTTPITPTTPTTPTTNLATLLAGKTLYTTIYDQIKTLESWQFDTSMSHADWQEMEGGSCTGNGELAVNGMVMTYTSRNDSCDPQDVNETSTLTVTQVEKEYLLISADGDTPQRVYFDEAKARDFYIAHAVENYFTGQTRYFANVNGGTGVRTYQANGTYTGTAGNSTVGGSYTISGDTLTLHNTMANRTLTLTHTGYGYEGELFDVEVTESNGSKHSVNSYSYRSQSARDAGKAAYEADHP